jgi:hypothetical protein
VSQRDYGQKKAANSAGSDTRLPGLTGGAGFRYKDHIAARFLLDLIRGTNGLGADFGQITSVDWQARDAGWLADDLAISCTVPGGGHFAAQFAVLLDVERRSNAGPHFMFEDESRVAQRFTNGEWVMCPMCAACGKIQVYNVGDICFGSRR